MTRRGRKLSLTKADEGVAAFLINYWKCIAALASAAAWLVGACFSFAAEAQEIKTSPSVFLYFENDLFFDTDEFYTNGVKVTWLSEDLDDFKDCGLLPRWSLPLVKKLPFVNRPASQRNVFLSLGQNMYTPQDISRPELITADRPYAGFAYLAWGFQARDERRIDTLELTLGVVGPSSLAEQTQKIIHRWTGSQTPEGWDNQLKDEPGLMLAWERKWRALRREDEDGFAFDCIPQVRAAVGNVSTGAKMGVELRFGYNLPIDFGSSLIMPGSGVSAPDHRFSPRMGRGADFGFHFFVGFGGGMVVRDIFLDGNTWQKSHRVDKEPFIGGVVSGVSLTYKRLVLTYTKVFSTNAFRGQEGGHTFGSVRLGLTF